MKRAAAGFVATAAGIVVWSGTPQDAAQAASSGTCVAPAGPVGPKGNQGGRGVIGDIGPQGATGATGPVGDTGSPVPGPARVTHLVQGEMTGTLCSAVTTICFVNGPAPQGPVGATGPQGATGAIGETGANGPTGPSGIWISGPPYGPTRRAHSAPRPLLPCSGFVDECTITLDGELGPVGDTGAQGDTGATGPQGATGATGPKGADVNYCGPQRAVHPVHAARPSVDVRVDGARMVAVVRPAVAGGSTIEIPAGCNLPVTGGQAGDLVATGFVALGAGLVVAELSKKRRWFRRAR